MAFVLASFHIRLLHGAGLQQQLEHLLVGRQEGAEVHARHLVALEQALLHVAAAEDEPKDGEGVHVEGVLAGLERAAHGGGVVGGWRGDVVGLGQIGFFHLVDFGVDGVLVHGGALEVDVVEFVGDFFEAVFGFDEAGVEAWKMTNGQSRKLCIILRLADQHNL